MSAAKRALPETLSIAETTRRTSLSRTTLYRHYRAGNLDVIRVGSRVLIDAASLAAFLEARRDGMLLPRPKGGR